MSVLRLSRGEWRLKLTSTISSSTYKFEMKQRNGTPRTTTQRSARHGSASTSKLSRQEVSEPELPSTHCGRSGLTHTINTHANRPARKHRACAECQKPLFLTAETSSFYRVQDDVLIYLLPRIHDPFRNRFNFGRPWIPPFCLFHII